MRNNTPAWIGLGLLGVAAIILVLTHGDKLPGGLAHDSFARIAMGVALLIAIGGSVAASYSGNAGLFLKQAVTWLGIGLALVVVYAFRPELTMVAQRTLGALVPGTPVELSVRNLPSSRQSAARGTVAITAGRGGHFSADALVNGSRVTFLIDTGASVVILTPEDARRAGINTDMLRYSAPVSTANGKTFAAPVRINEIRIGSISVHDVRALVSKPGQLNTSLLGMSFLQQLRSYKVSGNQLVLER